MRTPAGKMNTVSEYFYSGHKIVITDTGQGFFLTINGRRQPTKFYRKREALEAAYQMVGPDRPP
jgi:hypothetical protein